MAMARASDFPIRSTLSSRPRIGSAAAADSEDHDTQADNGSRDDQTQA